MQIEFMNGTWLTVSLIIAFIGLAVVGYLKRETLSDGLVAPMSMGVIACAIFWPIVLAIVAFIGAVSLPIFLGKYIGKGVNYILERHKKKEESLSDIEKIMKKRDKD